MDRLAKYLALAVMIVLAKVLWCLGKRACMVLGSREFWKGLRKHFERLGMHIERVGEVDESMPQAFKWFIPCVSAIAISMGMSCLIEEGLDFRHDDKGWTMVVVAVVVFLVGKRYLRSFWLRLALSLSVVMSIMGWIEIFEYW